MARLVAIGDSLTQGFQSFAVTHVDRSYPAMIARCMGIGVDDFRTPDFRGAGGLPCNLEWLARGVAGPLAELGWVGGAAKIAELIGEVEQYWERGPGSEPADPARYHNLAIWGFTVADAVKITADMAYRVATTNAKEPWFGPPSEPRMRTAWRVLNPALVPASSTFSQVEAARQIAADDGGIENLIVWLGANNCLGTVIGLDASKETTEHPPDTFDEDVTLWTPAAFQREYSLLAEAVDRIGAQNVFVGTVPHVTIAPIAKGIMAGGGPLPAGEKYFDYYTRFFIPDDDFDPERDQHLEKAHAIRIDGYVDEYNATIRAEAAKRGWHVVDTCKLLDELAVKRNQGKPTYVLPAELRGLDVRFLQVSQQGELLQGGLFSLDGVHPTSCGYALVAREFIRVMNAARSQGEAPIPEPDFAAIRAADSLVSRPPGALYDMEGALAFLEHHFHITRWLRGASGG